MVVAAVLMFVRLGDVKAPIWDEAYYVTTTARYHEGRAQFASHPPLGLLLIAAGKRLAGSDDPADLATMAAPKSIAAEAMPPGYDYFALRALPASFGVLCAGLFFILMLELTGSTSAAMMLSPLWLLDTALIAHFRAAHLDPFQLAFVLAAIICAVRALRGKHIHSVMLFGLFAMLASLVRANAVLLVVFAPFLLWPALRERHWRLFAGRAASGLAGAFLAISLVTGAQIATERALPDPATPAGRQDAAFLSTAHRAAIETGKWSPVAIAALWNDQRAAIAADLEGITDVDANGSHPWHWLIGKGAIIYRWDSGADGYSVLGTVANYAAWLVSLAGVVMAIWSLGRRRDPLRMMLLAAWLASMGALLWLDLGRVLYLYHYFNPLLLGHALAAVQWRDSGFPEWPANLAFTAVFGCFVYAAPFAFHQPVGTWRCAITFGSCEGAASSDNTKVRSTS